MIPRTDWEDPAYRIADNTSSPPVAPASLTDVVIHYPGAGQVGTLDGAEWFRNVNRAYINGRHYAIGYNWGYWTDGTEYELRGWDFRNAANAGHNAQSVSLLIVVAGDNPANANQIAAIRRRRAQIDTKAGRRLPAVPHSAVGATACPGDHIRDQIAANLFDPPIKELPAVYLIPPPPERPGGRWLIVDRGTARLATSLDVDDNVPRRHLTDIYRVQQYDELLATVCNRPVPA